mgnify:CR=1 FL=1
MPTAEALRLAADADLDLVEVAPNERPPVCRIMDYGKFKYDQHKKKGHSSRQTKTKEIRLRPKIGEHDVEFKIKQAIGFLEHKDKVVLSMVFRGREMAHVDEGMKVMKMVIERLMEVGKVETPPSQQGRRIVAVVAPK